MDLVDELQKLLNFTYELIELNETLDENDIFGSVSLHVTTLYPNSRLFAKKTV